MQGCCGDLAKEGIEVISEFANYACDSTEISDLVEKTKFLISEENPNYNIVDTVHQMVSIGHLKHAIFCVTKQEKKAR